MKRNLALFFLSQRYQDMEWTSTIQLSKNILVVDGEEIKINEDNFAGANVVFVKK